MSRTKKNLFYYLIVFAFVIMSFTYSLPDQKIMKNKTHINNIVCIKSRYQRK
jgi:hypothetical protein